jgi:hypothetical protein
MDKDYLLVQFLFICSLLVNLFFTSKLSIKILFIVLYLLFTFLYKENYIYNKTKYKFVTLGFSGILFLTVLVYYFNTIVLQVIIVSYIILFFYIFKIIFNKTYGQVISKNKNKYTIKIKDIFYKYNKTIILKSNKHYNKGDLLYIKLSKLPFNKKPIKIIKKIIIKKNN